MNADERYVPEEIRKLRTAIPLSHTVDISINFEELISALGNDYQDILRDIYFLPAWPTEILRDLRQLEKDINTHKMEGTWPPVPANHDVTTQIQDQLSIALEQSAGMYTHDQMRFGLMSVLVDEALGDADGLWNMFDVLTEWIQEMEQKVRDNVVRLDYGVYKIAGIKSLEELDQFQERSESIKKRIGEILHDQLDENPEEILNWTMDQSNEGARIINVLIKEFWCGETDEHVVHFPAILLLMRRDAAKEWWAEQKQKERTRKEEELRRAAEREKADREAHDRAEYERLKRKYEGG